jgi:hypothetical protein
MIVIGGGGGHELQAGSTGLPFHRSKLKHYDEKVK